MSGFSTINTVLYQLPRHNSWRSIGKKEKIACSFIDLGKAYDEEWSKLILQTLKRKFIPNRYAEFTRGYGWWDDNKCKYRVKRQWSSKLDFPIGVGILKMVIPIYNTDADIEFERSNGSDGKER